MKSNIELSIDPIVFSGPSAVGKTYLVKHLEQRYQAERLIATTTRPMRPSEVDMVDSHFLSEEAYANEEASGNLLLSSGFLGARYAFEHSLLDGIVQRENVPLVEIYTPKIVDYLGVIPTSRTVFLHPPSIEYLEERMFQRGQPPEEVAYRVEKAREEMTYFEAEGYRHYQEVYTLDPTTFDPIVADVAQKMQLQNRETP